ncbi:hypothetical protein Tco_0842512 [Tanacetum coccineum]|uniref:Uncharacterized protein n=1 Tax=Tanacetum coccineum TaxID=301880 RepID=A0ABQ5B004_9ASTR
MRTVLVCLTRQSITHGRFVCCYTSKERKTVEQCLNLKNGPLVYPTIEEDDKICDKKYAELTEQEKLQDDCDVQATNIVLQGIPPDVYSLVNHYKAAKDIWESSYSCKELNFHIKNVNVNCIMSLTSLLQRQVQVNTKFLNALQPEWSKFVTDVKLAKNMYSTNCNQFKYHPTIEEDDKTCDKKYAELTEQEKLQDDCDVQATNIVLQDVILREKLLNINRLIANIKSLNDNSTPNCVLKSTSPFPIPDSNSFFEKSDTSLSYSDNSLPEFESFSDHTEETSSGSTTTHANNSLPEYDSFHFEIEPDQGGLTSVVMEDILGEPRVHVPNVLPTHPTLMMDSDVIIRLFLLFSLFRWNSSFPLSSRSEDTIFDPGISTFHFSSLKPVAYENPIIPQGYEDAGLFLPPSSDSYDLLLILEFLQSDHVQMIENKAKTVQGTAHRRWQVRGGRECQVAVRGGGGWPIRA